MSRGAVQEGKRDDATGNSRRHRSAVLIYSELSPREFSVCYSQLSVCTIEKHNDNQVLWEFVDLTKITRSFCEETLCLFLRPVAQTNGEQV